MNIIKYIKGISATTITDDQQKIGTSLTQARHRALHQALVFEIAWLRPPLPRPVSYPGLHPNAAQAAVDPGKFGSGHEPNKPYMPPIVHMLTETKITVTTMWEWRR